VPFDGRARTRAGAEEPTRGVRSTGAFIVAEDGRRASERIVQTRAAARITSHVGRVTISALSGTLQSIDTAFDAGAHRSKDWCLG
jgi:hypothetical protein